MIESIEGEGNDLTFYKKKESQSYTRPGEGRQTSYLTTRPVVGNPRGRRPEEPLSGLKP